MVLCFWAKNTTWAKQFPILTFVRITNDKIAPDLIFSSFIVSICPISRRCRRLLCPISRRLTGVVASSAQSLAASPVSLPPLPNLSPPHEKKKNCREKEKLASEIFEPFASHLKFARDQISKCGRSGYRPRPTSVRCPLPQIVNRAPPPATAKPSGVGSIFSGIGASITDGIGFGAGNAVAHRVVDVVMGPRTISTKPLIGFALSSMKAIGSKYTEVTELWGEMKSIAAATSSMRFDQELLDAVLYTFVRGGFFSRANEVVEMMEKKDIFVDKYKYRMLFLKYHKTAYKGKTPKVQRESQLKKREAGLGFKKWLGLLIMNVITFLYTNV